ncbi:MAG: prolyl oligopeptidase family serine peptidase [Acidobacteriota bacterium]
MKNANGDSVESWLYPPLDPVPGKKYLLVLYIHGGPQGFDGDYFDVGLENQIFPAAGMAVLRVNYRGSTSYGEAFCHSLWGDWHWREYEDLMLSVDAAIATGWVDPDRLGLGGWSYGGIMTIWTVGHTDRFKLECLSVSKSITCRASGRTNGSRSIWPSSAIRSTMPITIASSRQAHTPPTSRRRCT